jgi:hypothetical protein
MFNQLPLSVKFTIAIVYDVLDFLSVPVLGSLYDAAGIPLGIMLWGPAGLINLWEFVDVTDQVDKFVPTMTLAGILNHYGKVG